VIGGELANRVHLRVEIEWREAATGGPDLGDALRHLVPDDCERIGCHGGASC
jgi:hypothetical protein